MAPACPPDVFARFPACYEEGGRGRWPGWVLIRDGGGEGGWLGRMRVTRDSVSVLIDPRRGRETGETERRVTEEGAAGGRFSGSEWYRTIDGLRARFGLNNLEPWFSCAFHAVPSS